MLDSWLSLDWIRHELWSVLAVKGFENESFLVLSVPTNMKNESAIENRINARLNIQRILDNSNCGFLKQGLTQFLRVVLDKRLNLYSNLILKIKINIRKKEFDKSASMKVNFIERIVFWFCFGIGWGTVDCFLQKKTALFILFFYSIAGKLACKWSAVGEYHFYFRNEIVSWEHQYQVYWKSLPHPIMPINRLFLFSCYVLLN